MGLFSHFYKRPRPNQVYGEDGQVVYKHEGEAWMDLFIDLVFVAFLIKLGQAITYCQVEDDTLETTILNSAAFLFFVFFYLRLELDTYANYFHASDVVSRILYFAFIMGIGAMAISMPGDNQGDCFYLGMRNTAMLGGFFLAQTSLITMYVIALRANPIVQPQLAYQVFLATGIILLFTLLGAALHRERRDLHYKVLVPMHIILSVPFLGQYIRPYFNEKIGPYLFSPGAVLSNPIDSDSNDNNDDHNNDPAAVVVVPLSIHAFQSRLCLFIMMVTGEGMIQIISPTLPENSDHYGRIVLFNTSGFVILFGNAMLYADAVLRENIYLHVMTRSPRLAGLFWTWMHVVTGFFIFLIGISIEIAIHDVYANEPILHAHDTIMGVSCGCITLCLNLMRATHKGIIMPSNHSAEKKTFKKNMYRVANYLFRSMLGVVHFVVAYFTYHEDSTAIRAHDKYIYMHACIVIVSISIEIAMSTFVKIRRRENPPRESEHELEHPSECSMDVRNSIFRMSSGRHMANADGDDDEENEDEEEEAKDIKRARRNKSSRLTASMPAAATSGSRRSALSSLSGSGRTSSSRKDGMRESLLSADESRQSERQSEEVEMTSD